MPTAPVSAWMPSRSAQETLRCTGLAALLLLATYLTHGPASRPAAPTQPGACHRAAASSIHLTL